MTDSLQQKQIEYGDFQTPLVLAEEVCKKLHQAGVSPDIIIEPTCGVGAFIEASASIFNEADEIIGVEINPDYLEELKNRKAIFDHQNKIKLMQGDFFDFEWKTLLKADAKVLVIGNFPWVTNSQQGTIGGTNLPTKLNFQNHSGLEAMTGKGNFDISEWMLIQTANWLKDRQGLLAMLCKTSVARKFLGYLHSNNIGVSKASIHTINAKYHFNVSVDACLLYCEFDEQSNSHEYEVFDDLSSQQGKRVGHRFGMTVRDLDVFDRLSAMYGQSSFKWRSGIKHDCSDVMEFRKTEDGLVNGMGKNVDIEPDYIYPLLKGSDVANNRTEKIDRYVLVTQKFVGESTSTIKTLAPKTWAYLEENAKYLDERKSRIYKENPRFSIFGVGTYTFKPYKIAICGLYKKLEFRLIHPLENRTVMFDDTVYFLSFKTQDEATAVFDFLNSTDVKDFYSSLIFWDEKRPIKSSILNNLNLSRFEHIQALRMF